MACGLYTSLGFRETFAVHTYGIGLFRFAVPVPTKYGIPLSYTSPPPAPV